MSGFTKGPWKINSISRGLWHIYEKGLGHIACITAGNGDEEKEQEANAHLIAAAPAMFEALEHVRDEIKGQLEVGILAEVGTARAYWSQMLGVVEAALALARGEK